MSITATSAWDDWGRRLKVIRKPPTVIISFAEPTPPPGNGIRWGWTGTINRVEKPGGDVKLHLRVLAEGDTIPTISLPEAYELAHERGERARKQACIPAPPAPWSGSRWQS